MCLGKYRKLQEKPKKMIFVLTTWSDLQLKNYVTEWDWHENINYVAVGILIYLMSV